MIKYKDRVLNSIIINNVKKEVIELEAFWYGGGYHFKLVDDKKGFAQSVFDKVEPYNIEDNKIVYFWQKVEELDVWNWKKKYPYWRQKGGAVSDGCRWTLKLRDRKGREKYCSGYMSFPRRYKDLIEELNNLFSSEIYH